MNKATFWKLIDTSRKESEGDPEAQIELLREKLTELNPDEIVQFDRIFDEYHNRAYSWNLWAAAYIIGGGCSDDGFSDFRGWLISRGEKVFEAASVNPETLTKVIKEEDGDAQIEGFQYVASQAWEEKTGLDSDQFPQHDLEYPAKPTGESWPEETVDLLFPKLAKIFS
jgi:Protein of unknown function (DUF4240)